MCVGDAEKAAERTVWRPDGKVLEEGREFGSVKGGTPVTMWHGCILLGGGEAEWGRRGTGAQSEWV